MAKENNLKQLQSLLAVMSEDNLTRSEFLEQFEKVINVVVRNQKENSEAIARLEQTYNALVSSLEGRNNDAFNKLKKEVDSLFVGDRVKKIEGDNALTLGNIKELSDKLSSEHGERLKLIDGRIQFVDSKMKTVRSGLDGSPDNPQQVKAKLKEAGLSIDDIPGLKEKLEDINEKASRARGGNAKKITFTQVHDLSTQVNGVTRTFTVPRKTLAVPLLISSQFPFILRPTVDFTLIGNTITLTGEVAVMQSTQTLIALLEVGFFGKV